MYRCFHNPEAKKAHHISTRISQSYSSKEWSKITIEIRVPRSCSTFVKTHIVNATGHSVFDCNTFWANHVDESILGKIAEMQAVSIDTMLFSKMVLWSTIVKILLFPTHYIKCTFVTDCKIMVASANYHQVAHFHPSNVEFAAAKLSFMRCGAFAMLAKTHTLVGLHRVATVQTRFLSAKALVLETYVFEMWDQLVA